MLQSRLIQLLTNERLVVHQGDESGPSGGAGEERVVEGGPLSFSPRLLHLHKDHEWFEVKQQKVLFCTLTAV